jgi:putative redox protein
MALIQIKYSKEHRTFTVEDEGGNHVNFQSIPETRTPAPEPALSYNVRPMQGLIMALGTCSGIDIVAILEKQRQEFESFGMSITAEREPDTIPSLWVKAHVDFLLRGNIDPDKAERAASLSINKYCSVAETLRRAGCVITYSVHIERNPA